MAHGAVHNPAVVTLTWLVATFAITRTAGGDVLTVDPGGAGTHSSIQAAIDAAFDGDEVVVNPGVYLERIDFLGKQITVRSSDPLDPVMVTTTVVDAAQTGHVVSFTSGETGASILEGLTIRNGLDVNGGGIYCAGGASPVIRFNLITGNACILHGGGIYCSGASPAIADNDIADNICEGRGGGVYASASDAIIERNLIQRNNAGCSTGGGIYLGLGSDGVTVRENEISANQAISGGGVEVEDTSCGLERNYIVGNVSSQRAGGVSLVNAATVLSSNIVVGNRAPFGAALDCNNAAVALQGNTIVGNLAEQAAVVLAINFSQLQATGNIIAFHQAGAALQAVSGSTIDADYNCLFGNTGGNSAGSVTLGPNSIFVDPKLAASGSWATGPPADGPICGGVPLVAPLSGPGSGSGDADYASGVSGRHFRVDVAGFPPGTYPIAINGSNETQIMVAVDGEGRLTLDTEEGTMPPTFPFLVAGDVVDVGGLASGALALGMVPITTFWVPGDEHLAAGSPCIDAGTSVGLEPGAADFDGQPRVASGTPDLGADEVVLPGTADADSDGDVDLVDVATLQLCYSGPGSGLRWPACARVDMDADIDTDAMDWQAMSAAVTGPLQ